MKTKRHSGPLLLVVVGLGVAIVAGVVWRIVDRPAGGASSLPGAAGLAPEAEAKPEYRHATEQELAVVRRALSPEGLIALAIDRFRIGMERYPRDIQELAQKPSDLTEREHWDGPYINNVHLLLDPWGQPYRYVRPGARNDYGYDLWSIGPDGEDATADDIGNW